MPRSNESADKSQRDSSGSKRIRSQFIGLQKMQSKLLDEEISKGDMKMRAALDSYLSVSESDNEEESKQKKECSDQKLVSKTTGKKTRNQTDKKSSSSGKQMAAAMYSGLISHSDTSGDEGI